jgi:hypothetical protein
MFSSCILWQYVLIVLIPIFGSSGKKTNIWSGKQWLNKHTLLYLHQFVVTYLPLYLVHWYQKGQTVSC